MNVKKVYFGSFARDRILDGVNLLTNAVQLTIGPKGRNVAIEKSFGYPVVTKDGVSVAKEIEVSDKLANIGVQMVKEVASKTSDVAGDGTTTATILARTIACEGNKYVVAGMSPIDLKRGIECTVEKVVAILKSFSKSCSDYKTIEQVGSISANSDLEIGKIIADAMQSVGKDGIITVEEGTGTHTTLDVVEGLQFERGYISPYFVTNKKTMICELLDPYILITDRKITNIRDLVVLLEDVAKEGKSLLIISEEVESEALATLVINTMRGVVKVCAVKAPGFGDRKKLFLDDISILTNTKVISSEIGMSFENLTCADLGFARRVVISKDTTTIINGGGNIEAIKMRIEQLKEQLEDVSSDYDKEKLRERIAKLSGGVAVIKVGAVTEIEMKEKKDRIEDALHATKAAVEEGVVIGGGVAFLRVKEQVLDYIESLDGDLKYGGKIIYKALESPFRKIVENAGFDSSVILNKIIEKNDEYFGFDVARGVFGNMMEFGILDPTKVCRTALQNAASIASLLIMTECLLVLKKDEKYFNKNQSNNYAESHSTGSSFDDFGSD